MQRGTHGILNELHRSMSIQMGDYKPGLTYNRQKKSKKKKKKTRYGYTMRAERVVMTVMMV